MAYEPMVANAADPEQVRRAEQKDKHKLKAQRHQLRTILKTDYGRAVLYRFLEHCRVFETTFAVDPYRTAYYAGQQDVGHWLMAEIGEADGTAVFRMMQEAAALRDAEEKENAAARTASVNENS